MRSRLWNRAFAAVLPQSLALKCLALFLAIAAGPYGSSQESHPVPAGPPNSNHASTDPVLQPYVQLASELTSRARANVYFANPQSIFAGVQINFVNVGTGNLTFLRRDMVTSGRIPLVLARVYDSNSSGGIDLGAGWSLSCAETISIQGDTARLSSESGAVIEFTRQSTGKFALRQDRPSDYTQLVPSEANVIQVKLRTGLTKQFMLLGDLYRLTKVTDRNGNEVRLIYKEQLLSRLENQNHFIELIRNQQGRIIRAEDDQGRRVQYSYSEKMELVEATDLSGAAWKYHYGIDGRLQSATDPMGRENFAVAYNEDGRVARLHLPSGKVRYEYHDNSHATTVTDRRRHISRFFQNPEGITVRVVNALGEETSIGLDAGRNPVSLSRNGTLVLNLEYDSEHRLIRRESFGPSGFIDTQYKYDPVTGLLTGIKARDTENRFTYDAHGNLISALQADGPHKYSYSAAGDLASFVASKTTLELTSNADGLFNSFKDRDRSVTLFDYKAGGELSEAQFPNGQRAKYEYQQSGLRSRLAYQDKRQINYAYDPVGNLLSTQIFDSIGKQVQGQTLTLNDTYQVTKRVLFDGTLEAFEYDPNGNLIKHIKNGGVTKFEYDELDRLVSIITPTGQRLTYSYSPGEHSIVEQYEHSVVPVADLRDTGSTFAPWTQVMAVRAVTSPLGTIRFSENLITFQLVNGTEILTPDLPIEQMLHRLGLIADSGTLRKRQNAFNRPFNTFFMPAEYSTINCCFSCSTGYQCRGSVSDGSDGSSCCPPCDPPLPTPAPPTPSISSIQPTQVPIGTNSQQVLLKGTFNSNPVVTVSGSGITPGAATLDNNGNVVVTFSISTSVTVGTYLVSESDDGGQSSTSVGFAIAPRIDSINPPMGLIATATQVTITGQGFGSTPTITVGGNITATKDPSPTDTKLTVTLNVPATSSAGGDQPLTVTNQVISSQGNIFHVQVPTKMSRISSIGAPGGIGPLNVITDGDVVDLNGKILLSHQCGVYRNYSLDIEEANGTSIKGDFILNETFSNFSSNPQGLTPPSPASFPLAFGLVNDIQFLGATVPACLGLNQNQSFDMSFTVKIGNAVFPLSTVLHIDRGNFNGTDDVQSTVKAP